MKLRNIFFKKQIIYRNDTEKYMTRWSFNVYPWISFKLHKIEKSDYDCLHDHPWCFISFILRGGYVEHTETGATKIIHPLSVIYRPAKWKHKLEIHQTAWTFVITFRKVREWGFWNSKGWTPWYKYQPTNKCD